MRPEPVSASRDRRHDKPAADGHGAAITPGALAGTTPCLTEHLDRFGSHVLNLSKPPPSLTLKGRQGGAVWRYAASGTCALAFAACTAR